MDRSTTKIFVVCQLLHEALLINTFLKMVQSIDKRQTALCTLMHVADDQQFREQYASSIGTHLPLPEIALSAAHWRQKEILQRKRRVKQKRWSGTAAM